VLAGESVKKCPFLTDVTNAGNALVKEASKEVQDDIIELSPVDKSRFI
jgi:hypothetical protein